MPKSKIVNVENLRKHTSADTRQRRLSRKEFGEVIGLKGQALKRVYRAYLNEVGTPLSTVRVESKASPAKKPSNKAVSPKPSNPTEDIGEPPKGMTLAERREWKRERARVKLRRAANAAYRKSGTPRPELDSPNPHYSGGGGPGTGRRR